MMSCKHFKMSLSDLKKNSSSGHSSSLSCADDPKSSHRLDRMQLPIKSFLKIYPFFQGHLPFRRHILFNHYLPVCLHVDFKLANYWLISFSHTHTGKLNWLMIMFAKQTNTFLCPLKPGLFEGIY